MPNHVRNMLTFNGDPERIREMLTQIQDDEEDFGSIDFNKLIPMPQELGIESGSRTNEGLKFYNDFLEIYTLGQNPKEMDLLHIPEERERPRFHFCTQTASRKEVIYAAIRQPNQLDRQQELYL